MDLLSIIITGSLIASGIYFITKLIRKAHESYVNYIDRIEKIFEKKVCSFPKIVVMAIDEAIIGGYILTYTTFEDLINTQYFWTNCLVVFGSAVVIIIMNIRGFGVYHGIRVTMIQIIKAFSYIFLIIFGLILGIFVAIGIRGNKD